MYANWQGNFLDISNHFISPERLEKIIQTEVGRRKIGYIGTDSQANRIYNINGKSVTLTSGGNNGGYKNSYYLFRCSNPDRMNLRQNGPRFSDCSKSYTLLTSERQGIFSESKIRKLHPIECERLQTLPDNYTFGVSDTQRYKALGNGWTVDVIVHLLLSLVQNQNNG